MTRVLQVMTSIVRPQKYINPATSTMVAKTQKITKQAPLKLPRKMMMVMKIAIMDDPMFWYSSLWITLSVTQFAYLKVHLCNDAKFGAIY